MDQRLECRHRRGHECWRVVREIPDYLVSCQGRVRSCHKRRGSTEPSHPLAQRTTPNGYRSVTLSFAGSDVRHKRYVHRIVLRAFVGEPVYPAIFAAHLNDERTDNRLLNLKWSTQRENESHKRLNEHADRRAGFFGSEPAAGSVPF